MFPHRGCPVPGIGKYHIYNHGKLGPAQGDQSEVWVRTTMLYYIKLLDYMCPTNINNSKSNFLCHHPRTGYCIICLQTLNIFVNWSWTPFRPGNSGCPHSISTKIQPTPLQHIQTKHKIENGYVFEDEPLPHVQRCGVVVWAQQYIWWSIPNNKHTMPQE